MGKLAVEILAAIRDEHYVFSVHAAQRLRQRRIKDWQVIAGLNEATLIREKPNGLPNPTVEFDQMLPDGVEIKSVWSWIAARSVAKLVTVHFYDR